jgi:hypothetical protein
MSEKLGAVRRCCLPLAAARILARAARPELTREEVAVLRLDDRGVDQSRGKRNPAIAYVVTIQEKGLEG